MYKKCTLVKMGTKTHQLGKNKNKKKALTPAQRAKMLSDWRKSWF